MSEHGSDWRSILLTLGAGGCAILLFASVAVMLAYEVLGRFNPALATTERTPLDVVVLASALVLIGLTFLPGAYFGLQRLRGLAVPASTPSLLNVWQGILLVLVWLGAALGAQFLLPAAILKWVTPLLYLTAIGVPAYFFARLATGGLRPGSRERFWGVLAGGLALGIGPAIVAEVIVALLAVVGIAAYVAFQPGQLLNLRQLAQELQNTNDLDQALGLMGPLINNPLAFFGALLFFSAISPLIEETTKSFAVWSVFDHLESPAQGFALGAMSGAAFGLVESLLVSATPGTGWTTTLLVRGASTMMHIMAASLTGWGIASLRVTRRAGRLIGMYLLAVLVHGTWNACVVAITFGSLRNTFASAGADPIAILLIAGGVGLLVMLCLGIPLALAVSNWHFRNQAVPSSASNLPMMGPG